MLEKLKERIHAHLTKAVGSAADIKLAVMASRHEISLDIELFKRHPLYKHAQYSIEKR